MESFVKFQELEGEVTNALKKKFKIKKLNDAQSSIAQEISKTIIINEEKNNWLAKVGEYLENPTDKNSGRINQVHEIAAKHGIDTFLASILLVSEI